MPQIISKEAFTAYTSFDLREAFELLADRKYLEVLNTESDSFRIVGQVVTFSDDSDCSNMSELWSLKNEEYKIHRAVENGSATVEYYQFESMNDARALAAQLLSAVTDDV